MLFTTLKNNSGACLIVEGVSLHQLIRIHRGLNRWKADEKRFNLVFCAIKTDAWLLSNFIHIKVHVRDSKI